MIPISFDCAKDANPLGRQFESVKIRLRQTIGVIFAILFAELLMFPLFFPAFAAEKIPAPNDGEKALIERFVQFDRMYVERQAKKKIFMREWTELGDELLEKRITFAMQYNVGENFLLRAALIAGECYLFASQEYFKKNDPGFMDFYEKGITVLEQVVIDADRFAKDNHKTEAEIVYLPDYSHEAEVKNYQGEYYVHLNPFAGRETIGTGFGEHATIRGRQVTYDIQPYASISEFLDDLKADLAARHRIRQISTTQTARTFLSHFCPWGVQMYFLLKQAGLTSNIDFRILRPYAEGLDKSFHDKLVANYESLFSSRRSYIPVWESSPMVSDLNLDSDKISCMMKTEMDCIVDDKNCKNIMPCEEKEKSCPGKQSREGIKDPGDQVEPGSKKINIHVDTIGNLGNRKIRWLWVGDPIYNIWYVSPTIYNWNISDYAKAIFNCYKWANGGLVWGAVSIGMDSLGGEIINEFFNFFETSPIPIPFFSNILTEGVKDQYSSMVTGEKIHSTGTIQRGKWLDPKDLFMDLTTYIFGSIESAERELFFGKLNPEDIKMGTTYDGTQIPPVLLVSNVTGVQDVPDDDYPNYINAVRFYTMYPKKYTYTLDYDLKNPLLLGAKSKTSKNRCIGWSKVQSPFGSYEIFTSFAPKAQVLRFSLSEKSQLALKSRREWLNSWSPRTRGGLYRPSGGLVEAELWTITPGGEKKYASVLLAQDGIDPLSDFEIWLINENHPSGPLTGNPRFPVSKEHERQNPRVLVPLKTQYELRIKVNGAYIKPENEKDKYLINFYSGPRGKDPTTGQIRGKTPVTGTLSSYPDDPDLLVLEYDKKIEIPLAKQSKGPLEPGKLSGTAGDGA